MKPSQFKTILAGAVSSSIVDAASICDFGATVATSCGIGVAAFCSTGATTGFDAAAGSSCGLAAAASSCARGALAEFGVANTGKIRLASAALAWATIWLLPQNDRFWTFLGLTGEVAPNRIWKIHQLQPIWLA